jgi:hypothetical protein
LSKKLYNILFKKCIKNFVFTKIIFQRED